MKKILIMSLIALMFNVSDVKANNEYYTNSKGVVFSENQYKTFLQVYNFDYVENITVNEFNNSPFKNANQNDIHTEYSKINNLIINNKVVETNNQIISKEEYDNSSDISLFAVCNDYDGCWETDYKKVSIRIDPQSYISDPGSIYVITTWKKTPTIKSIDLIGIRMEAPFTYITNKYGEVRCGGTLMNTYISSSTRFLFNNYGVGLSIDMPNCSNAIIQLQYSGRYDNTYRWLDSAFYGSYQHSITNITLAQSKQYSFGTGNLSMGNVFKFNNQSTYNLFDNMQGVRAN